MPVSFPAHQGLIAVVKLRWPRHVDGTALCIGAAAPDLAYPLGSWLAVRSHSPIGVVVWALPFTLVAAAMTRRWAAAGLFAQLPDLGPFRLRSYGVLSHGRPGRLTTLLSAILGSGSHVVVDAFTHNGRWGADLVGFNTVLFTVPFVGPISVATLAQHLGHLVGTVLFVILLLEIAGSRRLEAWYGADLVEQVRAHRPARGERIGYWAAVAIPTIAAFPAAIAFGGSPLFLPITVLTVSILVVSSALPAFYRQRASWSTSAPT